MDDFFSFEKLSKVMVIVLVVTTSLVGLCYEVYFLPLLLIQRSLTVKCH